MIQSLTLETVAEEFKHWRLTRKKKSKIPDDLLAKAFELKKYYPGYVVAGALKMSGSQIKRVLPPVNLQPKKALKLDFLSLEPPTFDDPIATVSNTPTVTCTFNKTDGTCLQLELREAQITEVLKVFLCYK